MTSLNLGQAVRIALKSYDNNDECIINVGCAWSMKIEFLVNLVETAKRALVPSDGISIRFIGLKESGAVSKYYGAYKLPLHDLYNYADLLITQQLNMAAKRRKFLKHWLEEETKASDIFAN